MNTLIILGSPRKNGNSERAARIVGEQLVRLTNADVGYLRLSEKTISPCIACNGCAKTGMCTIKDDMIPLYSRIDEADVIILAGPTYFYGLSAQLKLFIDRLQARWARKYLLREQNSGRNKRCGYLVCTAATQGKKLFDGSILIAKSAFDAIDVSYCGSLLIRGVDEKEALAANQEEVDRAVAFAADIVREMAL